MLLALDMFSASAALPDEVGLVIFNGRYGWEYTPLTKIRLGTNTEDVRDTWELLNMASRAGYNPNPYDGSDCWYLYNRRDFVTFPGGCYPAMPREYGFEAGTDHSSGVEMADVMFRESGADARYRAMIVVTDGRPNGTHPWAGYERMVDGHVETRWREYRNYAGGSTSGVRTPPSTPHPHSGTSSTCTPGPFAGGRRPHDVEHGPGRQLLCAHQRSR